MARSLTFPSGLNLLLLPLSLLVCENLKGKRKEPGEAADNKGTLSVGGGRL